METSHLPEFPLHQVLVSKQTIQCMGKVRYVLKYVGWPTAGVLPL